MSGVIPRAGSVTSRACSSTRLALRPSPGIVRRGAAPAGLTWHFARAPVKDLDYEMDLRAVARELGPLVRFRSYDRPAQIAEARAPDIGLLKDCTGRVSSGRALPHLVASSALPHGTLRSPLAQNSRMSTPPKPAFDALESPCVLPEKQGIVTV